MQINTNDPLIFPVEQIITPIDVENMDFYSQYMAVKLADKNYRENGYSVFHGGDFENNFILYLSNNQEKRYLDDYTKVKIGRSRLTDDVKFYCEKILQVIPQEIIKKLLHICRLCSYTGGPGFPDIILLNEDRYDLKYVLFDELQANQRLFLLLARITGINIGLVEVANKISDKSITVVPSVVLSKIMSDSRAVSVIEGLKEAIESERKKLGLALSTTELAQVEDEISWLTSESRTRPFHTFHKWFSDGVVSSDDLTENMGLVEKILADVNGEFDKYEKKLLDDPDYAQIAGKKHDEYMKKKADIMQKKFAIGPSKSKALLRFMEAR